MYCPQCGRPIEARAADETLAYHGPAPGCQVYGHGSAGGTSEGHASGQVQKLKAEGFARVRVNGEFYTLDDVPTLDKNKKHSIDLVVDRLVNKEGIRGRLADSV